MATGLACGSSDDEPVEAVCTPGQLSQCVGTNGCTGQQTCNADSTSYTPCSCSTSAGGAFAVGNGGSSTQRTSGGTTAPGSGGGSVQRTSGGTTSAFGGTTSTSSQGIGGVKVTTSSGGTTTTTATTVGGQGTCKPAAMTGFTYPAYSPARHLAGSCTEQAIKAYYTNCLMGSNCAAYATGAEEAQCGACLAPTAIDAAVLGPVLKIGNGASFFYRTNVAGCEELIGQTACAPKMQVEQLCQYNACAGSCPMLDGSSVKSLQQCMSDATTSTCSAEHAAANCLSDSASAFACFGSDFETQFVTIAKVFCA